MSVFFFVVLSGCCAGSVCEEGILAVDILLLFSAAFPYTQLCFSMSSLQSELERSSQSCGRDY